LLERGFTMSEEVGNIEVVTGKVIEKGSVADVGELVNVGDGGVIGGMGIWEDHLSANVVKVIVAGEQGEELGAIGDILGQMDDEDRRELGDMDYAVGAQNKGDEDGDIILLPNGVLMLRKVVEQIAKFGVKLTTLRVAQDELSKAAEIADDAAEKSQVELQGERDGLLEKVQELTEGMEKGKAEIERLKVDSARQQVECAELQGENAESQAVNRKLQKDLESSANALRGMTYEKASVVSEAADELEKAKSDFAESQTKVAVSVREYTELQTEASQTEAKYQELLGDYGALEAVQEASLEKEKEIIADLATAQGVILEKEARVEELVEKTTSKRKQSSIGAGAGEDKRSTWMGDELTEYSVGQGEVEVRMADPVSSGAEGEKWGPEAVLLVERDGDRLKPYIVIGLHRAEGEGSYLGSRREQMALGRLVFGMGLGNLRRKIESVDESAHPSIQVLVEVAKQGEEKLVSLQHTVDRVWMDHRHLATESERVGGVVAVLQGDVKRAQSRAVEAQAYAEQVDGKLDELPPRWEADELKERVSRLEGQFASLDELRREARHATDDQRGNGGVDEGVNSGDAANHYQDRNNRGVGVGAGDLSPLAHRRETINAARTGGAFGALGGTPGGVGAPSGVQGGSGPGSPAGRGSVPFVGVRASDSGGEFGSATPAGYGGGGSSGSGAASAAAAMGGSSGVGPGVAAVPGAAAPLGYGGDFGQPNGAMGGYGYGMNATMMGQQTLAGEDKAMKEAISKGSKVAENLGMLRWGVRNSMTDLTAIQAALMDVYEPGNWGMGEESVAEVTFFNHLDPASKNNMVTKYQAMKDKVPLEDMRAMERTVQKFSVIVRDGGMLDKYLKSGPDHKFKRYVIELLVRDFKKACVTVQDGEDVEALQEQAQYLWHECCLHYGMSLGQMYEEVDKFTTVCIRLKCPAFVNGSEDDVTHGLVTQEIYDRYQEGWTGRAKGQKKLTGTMVPLNVRNGIAGEARKFAEKAELTVVVLVDLIAKLPFMQSLPAGSVNEDTVWTSDLMINFADNPGLIAQMKDEAAVRKNHEKLKQNARGKVQASYMKAAGVGGLTVDVQEEKGASGKKSTAGRKPLPRHVTQDWTGKDDDVTRCLVPGPGHSGAGGHAMKKCPITVDEACTYNLVGCTPKTGQVVSRPTLQKSTVMLKTYAQREAVRVILQNVPTRGYFKEALQDLHASWKVVAPAGRGTARVAPAQGLQSQGPAAAAQRPVEYQQQYPPGYPAGKGMGMGKGQQQQLQYQGYLAGKGMSMGKGMPMPPQMQQQQQQHPQVQQQLWGGEGGPPSMVGSVQTGQTMQYGGGAAGTYGQQWGPGQSMTPYAQVQQQPWGAWNGPQGQRTEDGQSVWGSTDGISNAPEVDLRVGVKDDGKGRSMKTVLPVTVVEAECEEVTFALSPEEKLMLLGGDKVEIGGGDYALVGGASGAQAGALIPLFKMPNIRVGTSWIVSCELYRELTDGTKVYKTFYMKVDTGAEVSGATPEGAGMISTFVCGNNVTAGPSSVRGIGYKLVPVTTAIFPKVLFHHVATGQRRRQTLQVIVMEGATDRTHQILLGLDNFVGLGGMPQYGADGLVAGIYWSKIGCYSEVCTPASAARQFSW
jgi:hypothetical protein